MSDGTKGTIPCELFGGPLDGVDPSTRGRLVDKYDRARRKLGLTVREGAV